MSQYPEDQHDRFLEGEEEEGITAEDCWTVVSSFFDTKGLVSQQLDSFDEFVSSTMQELIAENSLITLDQNLPQSEDDPDSPVLRRYEIKFGSVLLSRPSMTEGDGGALQLYPQEARLRNLTYSSPMFVEMTMKKSLAYERPIMEPTDEEVAASGQDDIIQKPTGNTYLDWEEENFMSEEDRKPVNVFIGKLPIMVKSRYCLLKDLPDEDLYAEAECPYDQGGYFVINGSEKVLIAQERSAANIVQVFKKSQSNTPYVAEIRSAVEKGSRLISSMQIKLYEKGEGSKGGFGQTIKCTLPYIKTEIPIAIVFRALGVVSDEDILNHICYERKDTEMLEMLKPCLEEAFVIQEREQALDFIGRRGNSQGATKEKRVKYARDIMQKELLPHISQVEGSETRKAFFLGYMVNRLLQCALGRREVDDRDHFGKKRLDLAGVLLAGLFRMLYHKLTKDIFKYLQKAVEQNKEFNMSLAVKSTMLTNGLRYSLATGNWGDQKKAASTKAGVSQVLNRYTFASTLSHLRRTNTPIGRDGKIAKPRQLHNTHWGLVCPAETPEGQACGLVKNLALMCYITVGTPSEPIIDFMIQRNMEVLEEYEPLNSPQATKIFVNGVWVGVHRDPAHLVRTVQGLRRKGTISHEVSLIRDIRDREFKIFTDAGRVCRPLFVIDNDPKSGNRGNLVLTKQLVQQLEQDRDMGLHIDAQRKESEGIGWQRLIRAGVVEYVDAEEEETIMIVMTPEDLEISRQLQAGYIMPEVNPDDLNKRVKAPVDRAGGAHTWTHCEIHPSMILGICASIIPFPDHNQVSQQLCGRETLLIQSLVATEYISICYGQTGYGSLSHQL
jgi:DNA-directed RNA polymerase II subunit RPB2